MGQKINCDVCSCSYNEPKTCECTLENIKVAPCSCCKNGNAEDESFCHSYKKKSE